MGKHLWIKACKINKFSVIFFTSYIFTINIQSALTTALFIVLMLLFESRQVWPQEHKGMQDSIYRFIMLDMTNIKDIHSFLSGFLSEKKALKKKVSNFRTSSTQKTTHLWINDQICFHWHYSDLLQIDRLPRCTAGKESAIQWRRCEFDLWVGKVPHREGNDNPLQYSCLENSMGRGTGILQSMGSQRVRHDWAAEHTRCQ